MQGTVGQIIVTAASALVCALVLALVNGVRRMGASVRDTAAASSELVSQVATLQAHDAENRERIAVLWDREHWPLPSGPIPPTWNGTR